MFSTTSSVDQVQSASMHRVQSIDVLRGFDMLWILGADGLFSALFTATGWSIFSTLAAQMHHSVWQGLTAYDAIFPLFIFLSGVSLGLAAKPIGTYTAQQFRSKHRHATQRLMLLIIFGIIYNHGWGVGMPASLADIRYASVLGRIGIAWFVTALLIWHTSTKTQWVVCVAILLGYYLLLNWVTIGIYGGGQLSPEFTLNAWFDQHWLPGVHYHQLTIDPEGLLSNIPSIVNALLGALVGKHLRQYADRPVYLLASLLLFSLTLLLLGYWLNSIFPINKTLWSSSFVLVTVGYSVALLVLFYGLVDVLQWRRWAMPFMVIGMNSLVIYLLSSIFDWRYTAQSLFGGLIQHTPTHWHSALLILVTLLCQWLLLYWLYQRKIFIKV